MAKSLIDGLDEFYAQQVPGESDDSPGLMIEVGREKYSLALKVHPKQVAEAEADALAKGVPTHFRKDGRPLFTSRKHQKEYLRRYGYHNRDGGYGD